MFKELDPKLIKTSSSTKISLIDDMLKATKTVFSVPKKIIGTTIKTTVAVVEAGVNMKQGKSVDKVASEFVETIKSDNSLEAVKSVIEHKFTDSKTVKVAIATNEVAVKTHEAAVLASSHITILKEIVHIYDGRKVDGSQGHRARKYARFAAHSYEDLEDSVLPIGFKRIDSITTMEHMRATIYSSNDEIVCAFAGSSSNVKDWKNNITQVVGLSVQYDEALNYAKNVVDRYPGRKIVFVGHSKGGGEAAYCAYNLGMQAETFNPAALSLLTKIKSDFKEEAQINAYVFSTDILNTLQAIFGTEADGNVEYVPANAIEHGIHGILGILRYYKVKYRKIKRKRKKID